MRINYNKLTIVLNLILIVLVGFLLMRGNLHYRPMGFPHKPPVGLMFDELGLSQDQRNQLEKNREASRARIDLFIKTMDEKRQALAQELGIVQIDMNKVNKLHDELKAVMGQMEDAQLQDILKVRDILGQEKFRQFTTKIDRMMQGGRLFPGLPGEKRGLRMPPFMEDEEGGLSHER